MTLWTAFTMAGAMLLLAVTPGPGVFATVSRALSSGFRHAAFVVMGIVVGDLIFLLFAIFGLSALASLMGDLFSLVSFAGGCYLLWLGYKILTSVPADTQIATATEDSVLSCFFSGLVITLSNPKVVLFYLGFLPTFIDLERLGAQDIVLICLIVSSVLGTTMLAYAYTATKAKQMIENRHTSRTLNRVSGVVMMGIGSMLLLRG